ncbi:Ice-structuring protein [Trichinella spiralis]|uniref:Ice-structuring protein n=1 Tax=Trichinella spiralis TaxID=6334 RepID=UPI0001EFB5D9|nr:Ice-structuring protein [Trichinella spiralis]
MCVCVCVCLYSDAAAAAAAAVDADAAIAAAAAVAQLDQNQSFTHAALSSLANKQAGDYIKETGKMGNIRNVLYLKRKPKNLNDICSLNNHFVVTFVTAASVLFSDHVFNKMGTCLLVQFGLMKSNFTSACDDHGHRVILSSILGKLYVNVLL